MGRLVVRFLHYNLPPVHFFSELLSIFSGFIPVKLTPLSLLPFILVFVPVSRNFLPIPDGFHSGEALATIFTPISFRLLFLNLSTLYPKKYNLSIAIF